MREVNPKDTTRAQAFELWMKSPMPMVTLTKTMNISRLLRLSKKRDLKLNMLMAWCIGRAAKQVKEFYMLPVGDKLVEYDKLAIDVIVHNNRGNISFCNIPLKDNIAEFNNEYLRLTKEAAITCEGNTIEDAMVIGTSALVQTELDCIVNQYTELFRNPIVTWGKYRKGFWRTTLPVSFQFHHVQMDGMHAATFLQALQQEMYNINNNALKTL